MYLTNEKAEVLILYVILQMIPLLISILLNNFQGIVTSIIASGLPLQGTLALHFAFFWAILFAPSTTW